MLFTAEGERKLQGAERRLFVSAVSDLVELLSFGPEEDDVYPSMKMWVTEWSERPYLVLLVTEYLLGDAPSPEIRAWNQAIISDIFESMKANVDGEIDFQRDPDDTVPELHYFFNRQLVLDACRETTTCRGALPRLRSQGRKWLELVEDLSGLVLRDDDFSMYSTFADMNPQEAELKRKLLGLEEEFFTEAPPYLDGATKKRLDALNEKLKRECNLWYENFLETGRMLGSEA